VSSDRAVIIFRIPGRELSEDLDLPLDISANELVAALNEAYSLGIDLSDIKNCYLKAERPIALLRGNMTLAEFGIRNGSIIYFTE